MSDSANKFSQNDYKSGNFDVSRLDIYLQPHSDDICFSLAAFANKRHCGILLTVFSISAYVPFRPHSMPPSAEWVTKTRIAEDRAFAEACGLSTHFLEFQDAQLLGRLPFDLSWVKENLQRIEKPVLSTLLGASTGKPSNIRPWLFCPVGIGGHADHVAIRMLVNQNYDQLSPRYRIGFYEDLHYASSAPVRNVGINNLWQDARGRQLKRYVFPLGRDVSKKLALLHFYKSQFLVMPKSIDEYTPAAEWAAPPHEAIWSDEQVNPLPDIV